MYPIKRNRRLRSNESIRSLVRETVLTPTDFLVPLFVVEGKGIKDEIPSMPNYYRFSLDTLKAEVISEIQQFSQDDLYTPQQMFCICLLIHISKKQEDLQTFLDLLSM